MKKRKARAYVIDGHNGKRYGPSRNPTDRKGLEHDRLILEKHAQSNERSFGVSIEGDNNWSDQPVDSAYKAEVKAIRAKEAAEQVRKEKERKAKEKKDKRDKKRRAKEKKERARSARISREARHAAERMARDIRGRSDNDRDRDTAREERGRTA